MAVGDKEKDRGFYLRFHTCSDTIIIIFLFLIEKFLILRIALTVTEIH